MKRRAERGADRSIADRPTALAGNGSKRFRTATRRLSLPLAAASVIVVALMANPAAAATAAPIKFTAPFTSASTIVSNTNTTCGSGTAASTAQGNPTTGRVHLSVSGAASKGTDCAHAMAQSGFGFTYTATHNTSASPPARNDAMMAYDAKDGYVVLFGGQGPGFSFGDTWKYQNGTWTEIHSTPSPPGVAGAEMVYDASDGYVLLYDGPCGKTCDTWSFSGGVWKNITPSSSPALRNVGYLGYDAADGYVVLFGGFNGSYLNDSWKFHHGTWTQLSTPVAPSPRADSNEGGLVYDAKDRYLVLFGGDSGWGSAPYYNDTWTFSHGAWTLLAPSVLPAARAYQTMSYDPRLGGVVMFGGIANPKVLTDTWLFSGGNWTQLAPKLSPSDSYAPSSAYDPSRGYIVLFGGGSQGGSGSGAFLSQTWTLRPGGWHDATPPAAVAEKWTLHWTAQAKGSTVIIRCFWLRCAYARSYGWVDAVVNFTVTDTTANASPTAPFGSSHTFVSVGGSRFSSGPWTSSSSSPSAGLPVVLQASGSLTAGHTYRIESLVTILLSVYGATYTKLGKTYTIGASASLDMTSPNGGQLDWIKIA